MALFIKLLIQLGYATPPRFKTKTSFREKKDLLTSFLVRSLAISSLLVSNSDSTLIFLLSLYKLIIEWVY